MEKVLIVDDAAFMRLSLRTLLETNGYQVVGEAENGTMAIRRYIEYKPDIVTMDITMPGCTGIEALKEILKIDPKANVIMISAMGQERLVRDSIIAGAQSFIVKPYNEEPVLKTIKQIVEREIIV
ncbi:response regulator [Paenibacillus wynnii]|uniref:response regulator n=1 Tax=Paenibacillus wynnii TaxID=268407 RepID=UPI00279394FC|nr:response regulator [Paenibacillus wynnii]MDQ0192809.1 two-component system chemotaxis response regulator CheY [Paenibacillus wynnii]